MKSNLNAELQIEASPEDKQFSSLPERSRRPYLAPKLTCYGNVADLTQNGGGSGSDGTGKSMVVTGGSDPRIKENCVRIGTHPLGLGIWLFDYKPEYRSTWGQGRQFGVMADEVERVLPEAVSVHPDGYKTVNYAMLGITRTLRSGR